MSSGAKKLAWWKGGGWKKVIGDEESQERYKIAVENGLCPNYKIKGSYYIFEDLNKKGYIPLSSIEQSPDVLRAILKAMNKLHSLGIVHSDLHVDNIFIHPSNLDVKFIDFESCLTGNCNNLTFEEASKKELESFPVIDSQGLETDASHFLLGAPELKKEFENNKELQEIYYCKKCNGIKTDPGSIQ